jgi:membrane protease subunit HflK
MAEPHDHSHEPRTPTTPEVQDVGSRALAEALGSSFFFVKIVMIILLVVFAFSGIKTISEQERGIRLRFGKASPRLLEPGLHLAWPAPIDEIVKIPIGEIQKASSTVGFPVIPVGGTLQPQQSFNPSIDKYTLTGDGNIVHAQAIMGYRVTDAVAYVFGFTNAADSVVQALNSALIWAVGGMSVDEALLNKDAFRSRVVRRVTQLIDELKLGITLDTLTVEVITPASVKDEFTRVTSAQQDLNTKINNASAIANAMRATAGAEATAIINFGRNDATNFLIGTKAESEAFQKLLVDYRQNPELFRQLRLTETWRRVFENAKEKLIIPERAGGEPYQIRLKINRQPESLQTNAPAR